MAGTIADGESLGYKVKRRVIIFHEPRDSRDCGLYKDLSLSERIERRVNTYFTDPGWHLSFHPRRDDIEIIGVFNDLDQEVTIDEPTKPATGTAE